MDDLIIYDVVIIGGGPSALATAIKLKQLSRKTSVAIFEKGSKIGSHIISGCVIESEALSKLIPNWLNLFQDCITKVNNQKFYFFSKSNKFLIPYPKNWKKRNEYIVSLSKLCVNLAKVALDLGVEIFEGIAIYDVIIEDDIVKGVKTVPVGIDKDEIKKDNFVDSINIYAKQIVIAEGARGFVAKKVINYFHLDKYSLPQTYGLGIKEIWEIDSKVNNEGKIIHCIGYPLNNKAFGGGFLYYFKDNKIAIGLVSALNYKNPTFNPYEEFNQFKLHPFIKKILKNGKRLEYGARVVSEGGVQSLPKLSFKGGVLIGDSAGFLNVATQKGVNNAIYSGMLAATSILKAIKNNIIESNYNQTLIKSKLFNSLYRVRNIRPSFNYGLIYGIIYSVIEYYLLRGLAFWTLKSNLRDNETLLVKKESTKISYPGHDLVISFDKVSSIYLSNIKKDEDVKSHLHLKNINIPITINYEIYDSPEIKYCPASVYELSFNIDKRKKTLKINAQNCIHCKACDVKDPLQNIQWLPPNEIGGGPQYQEM